MAENPEKLYHILSNKIILWQQRKQKVTKKLKMLFQI